MAFAENPKLHDLIRRLQECFTPIYAQWLSETKPAKPAALDEMLANDVIALGLFISAHDAVAAPLEKKLLAEILTFLTPSMAQMPYEYVLTALDTRVEQLGAGFSNSQPMPTLATLDLAKQWAADHSERKAQAQILVGLFSQIANAFVFIDGNVSDIEIKFLNDFDGTFAIA